MNKLSIFKELIDFLIARKKWWLIPIIVLSLLLGILLLVSQNPVVTPFIYTLF